PHPDVTVGTTAPGGAAVTYTDPTATDAVGVTSLTCAPGSGSTFPVGTTPVTCTATDAAGNTSTSTFSVIVVLDHPPVIMVPSDLRWAAPGPDGAAVSYTVSFTDPDGTIASSGCTPASGATFPLGATTVNCTATDNDGATTTASFKVTVVDTTAPVIAPHP